MRIRIYLISLILCALCVNPLFAQVIPPGSGGADPLPPDARIGSYYSVLPIAGYTSDLGLFGGGFLQRINYDINVMPFHSMLKTDVTFSTRGNIISKLQYERTSLFGWDVRAHFNFIGQREKQAHYFGIGNDSELVIEQFDDGYFFYENRELYMNLRIRNRLTEYGRYGKLDLFGEALFWLVNGLESEEESRILDDMPAGFGKSQANSLGFGLIADSRNNEFSPNRGYRYEAGFRTSQNFLGSNHTFSNVRGDFRHFRTLFGNVVLAQRLQMEHNFGEAPFWAMPLIGNEMGLRGYHRNRFRGNSSVLNLLEVRSWLFTFLDDQVIVGMQAFWDTGRVYSDFDSNGLFDDWRHTFGIGGAISVFNPDFILRGDVAFSNEAWRIYFGTGFIF